MNNNRSVWSPISPSTTTAVDDYNSAVDHHRLQPMTTSTSNINPFQFGPLSTDYDSNLLQNGNELTQGQNSSFNSVYHNIGSFNNSSLINASSAGINSYSNNSHSTVALNYSDQQKNQQPFQPSETLFRSPNFVTTPMGYPYGSDPSYLYNPQNFSSVNQQSLIFHYSTRCFLISDIRYFAVFRRSNFGFSRTIYYSFSK